MQRAFAAHLRDPLANPPPTDVAPERMAVYSKLFFNNVVSFLGGYFPVLASVLGEERWQSLVRDFYRVHSSHTPLFPQMPTEFLDYLEHERLKDIADDPPYLQQLAQYEWAEAAIMLAEASRSLASDPKGDTLRNRPVLADPAWLLHFHYPVHEIGPDNPRPERTEQPLYFLIFRNPDDKIVFLKLNPVSARLFELLHGNGELSGHAALLQIANELQHPQPEHVLADGKQILDQWRARQLIIGTR